MYNANALRNNKTYISAVISRYVKLATLAGVDSLHRRFAIQRWKHRKRGTAGTLTVEEWKEMIRTYGGRCPFCQEYIKLTVEHVVPKALGGGFSVENIVPACAPCNNLRCRIYAVSPRLLFSLEFPLYSPSHESRILRMADPVRLTWFNVWAQVT
ncbi:hypothetical protein LCGC14_1396430 [marine sediment metagenome]|uniref:HNH nuclease domain-containing protein n=1 Tax=marine sediment metagenome TaxID=412755 RepID=A0A0F9N000_9ZZZZ